MELLATALKWSLPFLVLLAVAEGLLFKRLGKASYDWGENLVSGALGIMSTLSDLLFAGFGVGILDWLWTHRAFTIPLDTWWGWLLLFFAVDFAYYWQHRFCHEIRWFWASHMVHHTPTHYNLAMGYRVSWAGKISGVFLFYSPLVWLGFSPLPVFLMLALNLHYQFWLHTQLIGKLGWFEKIFNTPFHHRVHHAANIDYLDRNYGGVLIVFDKLFGTFAEERSSEPCRYGLVHPVASGNPLVISVSEWLAICRDVLHARTMAGRLSYLVGRPGWRENGKSLTTDDLRRSV